ncbi:MAG: thiol:disulfide interchange protein DsbA/DsbL [Proteobacteria bacterium]|nr:MAG: thiol:disulfide interchange protein DsbA/DsbL [Pseudomonadota bacterium]
MKKLILLLAITLIWGCSQANESDNETAVKKQVAETTQAVKQDLQEKVDKEVKEAVVEQTAEAQEQAQEVVEQVVEQAAEQVDDHTGHNHPISTAATSDYQAGIHYNVITPAWDTGRDDVVIYEFFSYMCAHCNSFQPYMKRLEADLPDGVKVQRVPVVFYPQWRPHAQAFYTFEAMNLLDQVHAPFFAAIHQHKKQFRNIEDVADWVAGSFNVDRDKFLSTAKSFMVDGQIRKGMQMMQAMNITSTPTLVVNGKYTPNREQMRSRDDVIKVAETLALQEAK